MIRKKVKFISISCICLLGICVPMFVMAQPPSRKANIKSSGNINFNNGEVFFASSDLMYLADEIDHLENTYKQTTVSALNDIGTFFLQDGTLVYDMERNEADTEEEKSALSFGAITEGIKKSQSIDGLEHIQVTDKDGNLLFYEGEEAQEKKDICALTTTDTGFPAFYQEANANHLSAGTAAWINGTLIKGNGSDNADYYAQGVIDGMTNALENIDIQYTYHVHEGEANQEGGCYGKVSYQQNTYCTCRGFSPQDHGGCNCGHASWAHGTDWCKYVMGTTTAYKIALTCGKTTDTIESATIIY